MEGNGALINKALVSCAVSACWVGKASIIIKSNSKVQFL